MAGTQRDPSLFLSLRRSLVRFPQWRQAADGRLSFSGLFSRSREGWLTSWGFRVPRLCLRVYTRSPGGGGGHATGEVSAVGRQLDSRRGCYNCGSDPNGGIRHATMWGPMLSEGGHQVSSARPEGAACQRGSHVCRRNRVRARTVRRWSVGPRKPETRHKWRMGRVGG